MLGPVRVIKVPIPHDCTDGFLCAYWRRPGYFLDEGGTAVHFDIFENH